LTNISAALGVAQMERINEILANKRETANLYKTYFKNTSFKFVEEPPNCKSNYWLNSIILKNKKDRDEFLQFMNNNGIMTRPVWRLMNRLEMYKDCQKGKIINAEWLEDRLVNLPSSVRSYEAK
jgi:dTDP-4-amino-4,6-dideoxygalactose transaminase